MKYPFHMFTSATWSTKSTARRNVHRLDLNISATSTLFNSRVIQASHAKIFRVHFSFITQNGVTDMNRSLALKQTISNVVSIRNSEPDLRLGMRGRAREAGLHAELTGFACQGMPKSQGVHSAHAHTGR